jgi:hypothetical protein
MKYIALSLALFAVACSEADAPTPAVPPVEPPPAVDVLPAEPVEPPAVVELKAPVEDGTKQPE